MNRELIEKKSSVNNKDKVFILKARDNIVLKREGVIIRNGNFIKWSKINYNIAFTILNAIYNKNSIYKGARIISLFYTSLLIEIIIDLIHDFLILFV